jgi:hypothetical protein
MLARNRSGNRGEKCPAFVQPAIHPERQNESSGPVSYQTCVQLKGQIGPVMASRKRQQRGIHLVKPKSERSEVLVQGAMGIKFNTGEIIPQSGIYQVIHTEHRLPHEVTLLRSNPFPPCAQCGNNVTFKLLRGITVDSFAIILNAIPEMTDSQVLAATDSQSLAAAAGEDDTEKAS